eukprot:7109983-Pyramimonas_sp.AAC.1
MQRRGLERPWMRRGSRPPLFQHRDRVSIFATTFAAIAHFVLCASSAPHRALPSHSRTSHLVPHGRQEPLAPAIPSDV